MIRLTTNRSRLASVNQRTNFRRSLRDRLSCVVGEVVAVEVLPHQRWFVGSDDQTLENIMVTILTGLWTHSRQTLGRVSYGTHHIMPVIVTRYADDSDTSGPQTGSATGWLRPHHRPPAGTILANAASTCCSVTPLRPNPAKPTIRFLWTGFLGRVDPNGLICFFGAGKSSRRE